MIRLSPGGTDPANVKKYDIINASFSGRPTYGPVLKVGNPIIVDPQTFDVNVTFSQSIDPSSINISNLVALDPTGKSINALSATLRSMAVSRTALLPRSL
jgi:hypothetical protein